MHKLLFLLLTAIAFASCKRDKAMWDTDLAAPLLRDTLTLENLVEDSMLYMNGGVYTLRLDRTLYDLKIAEVVKIPDTTIENKIGFAFSGFTIPAGYQFVNNTEEHDLNLAPVQLKKIRIASGGINVTVRNPLATKALFTVELPGVTLNGVTLSRSITVNAGTQQNPGEVTQFVDLTGYEADLTGIDGSGFNTMQSKMVAQSDPAGGPVIAQAADSISFFATMQNLKVNYAKGYFGQQEFSDTTTQYIDALGKIAGGMIDLPSVALNFDVTNSMKVAGKFKITTVENMNAQNSIQSLTGPVIGNWNTVNAATGGEYSLTPAHNSYVFNSGNSNIEQFLENHGSRFDLGFKIQLNPWGNTSGGNDEIFPQSSLKVNLSGDLPLQIGLQDLIIQDTFSFALDQAEEGSKITGASLWLEATNAFPLQGEVVLYLMDSNHQPLATLTSPSPLASSVYGSLNNGLMQKTSMLNFVIPSGIFDDLRAVKYLSVKAKLNTPDVNGASTVVQIPENAFIRFKAGAKLQMQVVL